MKLAVITNFWKNSDGGGIKTYLVNLVDVLKSKGLDVNVLFRLGNDSEHFCGGKNKIAFTFRCYQQLRKIQPDVIHSQGAWYCLLAGVLYKKIHGCRLILTFHTEPDKKLSFIVKTFFQNLINSCDCVTFVSLRLRERIIEVDGFSFPKTAITYAGVQPRAVFKTDVEQFRKKFMIGENNIVLLAQAMTAHPLKADGLKLMIQSIRILKETYPNILLVATRDGAFSERLKSFTHEIGVEKHVIFTGDIENPFIPLEICDIYIHTPLGEGGVSIALLEAMAIGKPIVATSVGGIPEAIINEENGLLVMPNEGLIAEKIDFLLHNPMYADNLGNCAKKTVNERFTWEIAAEKFMGIYMDS